MARKTIYLSGNSNQDSPQHHLVPEAVVVGGMLFTGGIAGCDPATGRLPETHEEQAALAYDRLEIILNEAGYPKAQVGHWFIWAPQRHSRIAPVNPHWERWFPTPASRPARHALARQLDPGQHYRIEIIGVARGERRAFEINDRVYHTGGSEIPGFMPFGTSVGDLLFTGPTYGMYSHNRRMGETAPRQAELCRESNGTLYQMAGFTEDNLVQMFVWYHNDEARAAAVAHMSVMFPDPNDRPAIHYIYSPLPYWGEVEGQFLIQYDIIGVRGAKRRVVNLPGVTPLDGEGGAVPAAVAAGNLCFTSVCTGADVGASATLEEQTRSAFRNGIAAVEAAGFSAADLGHAYVWVPDLSARDTVDKVWAQVFPRPEDRPARHTVVCELPAGTLAGVEFTAVR